jgi:hypothetical protein
MERKSKKMPQSKLDAVKTGWVHRVDADIAQMVADETAQTSGNMKHDALRPSA